MALVARLAGAIAAMALLGGCGGHSDAADTTAPQESAVKHAVQAYFDSLGQNNLNAAVDAYTPDGVLESAGAETVQGTAALRAAYADTFQAIRFGQATHNYDEVRIYGDQAFVRTSSEVATTSLADDTESTDRYREFFILKKTDIGWKIDRYLNNKPTTPAPPPPAG